MQELNAKCKQYGEFHHIMKQLRKDVKFVEYLHLATNKFNSVLAMIKNYVQKQNLNYKDHFSRGMTGCLFEVTRNKLIIVTCIVIEYRNTNRK